MKNFLSSIVWAVIFCASGTATAFDNTDLLKVVEFKECAGCDLSRVYLTETHLEGANNDRVGFLKVADSMPESATSLDEPLDTSKVQLQMGPQVTLLGDGEFGLKYFPDMQVTVLQQTPTLILIMASTEVPLSNHTKHSSYLLEGSDVQNLTSAKLILSPGAPGEFDNGAVEASGTYQHSDGTWYLIYHAEDRETMTRSESGGIPSFYARIALASSTDGGNTWTKLGPIITSTKPKGWTSYQGQSVTGTTAPTVVVSKNGEYLYAYYTDHSRIANRGAQIFMARSRITDGPPLAGTWKKYYRGNFNELGLGGFDTPIINGQDLAADGDAMKPGVVYSAQLDKYIMIMNLSFWKELQALNSKHNQSGMYFSYSDDGIEWSRLEPLIIENVIPVYGKPIIWLGTIIWDEGKSTEGWLIYSYSPAWGWDKSLGHVATYMVGRRIIASHPNK